MKSAERYELPIDFSVRDFKPGYAWRRAAVGPSHAARIKKQDIPASFVSRNVRVAVQQNINIVQQLIGWNVLQTKFQPASHDIDNQWPFKIAVTISAHQRDPRTNRAQLIENRLRANISKVPDLICVFGHLLHAFR